MDEPVLMRDLNLIGKIWYSLFILFYSWRMYDDEYKEVPTWALKGRPDNE